MRTRQKEEVMVAEGDEELINLVDSVYDKMSEIAVLTS